MTKKKPKDAKSDAVNPAVPQASPEDVHDDPGPTRAVPAAPPVRSLSVQPWDDVSDGDTLNPDEVYDDPGPTKALPAATVLEEIETATAAGRSGQAKQPGPKAKKGKKKR